jgi:hypothetical protein
LQFWKGSSRDFSDFCLIWQRIQKMHFKAVPLEGKSRRPPWDGDFPPFFIGERPTLGLIPHA